MHGEHSRRANVVAGFELAGFENDFEHGIAANIAHGGDCVLLPRELAAQKETAGNDHIDFIAPIVRTIADFGEQSLDERWIDADRKGGWRVER